MNYYNPPSFHQPGRPQRRWLVRGIIGLVLGAGAAWAVGSASGPTFTVIRNSLGATVINIGGSQEEGPKLPKLSDDPEYTLPTNDKDRLDVLLLGMRGDGDAANGSLLTDTIMLLSLDTKTGRASLVSIPRDLTVRISDQKTDKINAAYAHNGLDGSKRLFSRILGVGVDNIVVIDFNAFKTVIDTLGGVTITLDRPFEESQQWAGTASESYVFSLPAGPNTLDGQQALYYVRSRYSSSDFDRSRRQQQVMVAIKNKVAGLDLASDPIKALEIVTTVRKHIETDLDILDLGTIKDLMQQSTRLEQIRRYQLHSENLLYETKIDGIYELLPRDGTLAHVKRFFQTVLTETPVFPVPADPSPSTPTLSAPASASQPVQEGTTP